MATYSIGDKVVDEDGDRGIVVIRWNDGDICEYENDRPIRIRERRVVRVFSTKLPVDKRKEWPLR